MSGPKRIGLSRESIEDWGSRRQAISSARGAATRSEAPADDAGVSASGPVPGAGLYPVRNRGSLPRFHRTAVEEAHLLAASEAPVAKDGQLLLRIDEDDVVDGCPAWLIEMYRRADAVQRIRGPMPMSFAILLGALVTFPVEHRTGGEVIDEVPLDDIIGWCHPERWRQRARDWRLLDAAFEELPSYRIPVGDHRFWVVIGEGLPREYRPGATVWLRRRVPASAAHGIRINWPQLLAYRRSALLTRAYLSVHALLDRSAHRGHPLTREIYAPMLDPHGDPRRRADGRFVRSGTRVPNPVAHKVGAVRAMDIAKFLGMRDSKAARHDARAALARLHADGVVEVVSTDRGYRFFGVLPRSDPTSGP